MKHNISVECCVPDACEAEGVDAMKDKAKTPGREDAKEKNGNTEGVAMKRCKTCQHWWPDRREQGECRAVSDEYGGAVPVLVLRRWRGNTAYPIDYVERRAMRASLVTAADFSCANWKPLDGG